MEIFEKFKLCHEYHKHKQTQISIFNHLKCLGTRWGTRLFGTSLVHEFETPVTEMSYILPHYYPTYEI